MAIDAVAPRWPCPNRCAPSSRDRCAASALDGEVLEAAGLVGAEISPVIVASALERPLTESKRCGCTPAVAHRAIHPAGRNAGVPRTAP